MRVFKFFVFISEWIEEYHLQYPDTKKLQLEVDEFMAKFDEDREKVKLLCLIYSMFN